MDRWKYFDITHRDHLICNPTSVEKMDEIIQLLRLDGNANVLEIACGKGEFLVRTVERYGCSAVGVDLSPFAIADARSKVQQRISDANVELIEQDGSEFAGKPASFDLSVCLGASWIWSGHRGTLTALRRFTRPGGYVLVGEPFWRAEPTADYLEAEPFSPDDFGTHAENVFTGLESGLTPLYAVTSTHDEWDRYEALQWQAAERWAVENPDDPDCESVLQRVRNARDVYLRWGRDTLGWGVYLFRA